MAYMRQASPRDQPYISCSYYSNVESFQHILLTLPEHSDDQGETVLALVAVAVAVAVAVGVRLGRVFGEDVLFEVVFFSVSVVELVFSKAFEGWCVRSPGGEASGGLVVLGR
jgi:hypothetical protein